VAKEKFRQQDFFLKYLTLGIFYYLKSRLLSILISVLFNRLNASFKAHEFTTKKEQ